MLSRHLLRLHLAPFGVALAGLTALMAGQLVLRKLPDLHGKGLPLRAITDLLGLSVPYMVAVTLPMSVLVAVLWVFTHLASDGEIRAGRWPGVASFRLFAPVLGAAACVAAFAFLWNDQVLPRTNHRLRGLVARMNQQTPLLTVDAAYKSDREMTTSELRRAAHSAREDADRAVSDGGAGGAIAESARRRAAMYEVELQKKYAMAAACFVFALFGAPVALRFERGGAGLVIGLSLGMYVLYYVSLISGEELGDRLIVSPFFAMWTMNLIVGTVGLVALWRVMGRGWSAQASRD